MTHNFTIADITQTIAATLSLALFLLPAGYLLSVAGNLFGFRRSGGAEKFLFSVAVSAAATPILAVLLVRYFGFNLALGVFLLAALAALVHLFRRWIAQRPSLKLQPTTWIGIGLAMAWLLVVLLSLADWQVGHKLYVSYVMYDHSVRIPFVAAVAHTGVPPLNPFYGLGQPPMLRYYYYWYVVCALPMKLFGLSPKACLDASIFWSALGLASTIPLFLKHFFLHQTDIRRRSLVGIALLAVTGLDLIPYAVITRLAHRIFADMEWWDTNQVTSWVGSLLWVPHHVASLTACMVGLLFLASIDEKQTLRERAWMAAICGMAFAGATGLSIYVTLVFAIFVMVWSLWVLMQKEFATLGTYVAAGAVTVLLSWPFLADLMAKGSGSGGEQRIVFFAFRRLTFVFDLLVANGVTNPLIHRLLDLPVLIVVYFFEFGVFFVTAVLYRRMETQSGIRITRQQRMGWTMFVTALTATTFLQSAATDANDFGFRGILVVQFILLLWASEVVYEVFFAINDIYKQGLGSSWIKPVLMLALILGALASVYQISILRLYAPLADRGILERTETRLGGTDFAEQTYWLREGYEQLQAKLPAHAMVQYNPDNNEVLITHLYNQRQALAGDAGCNAGFGGDPHACAQLMPYIQTVFNEPIYVRQWNLDGFCRQFHVHVLVATPADPVWSDPESWVWRKPLLYGNVGMRAVNCGK
jgi:hypothetical protein